MATVTINNSANGVEEAVLSISHFTSDTVAIIIFTHSNNNYTIDWGDGVIETGLVSGVNQTHTYIGDATQLKIFANNGLEDIYSISNLGVNYIQFTGNISEFSQFITLSILISKGGLLTGTLNDIPKTLDQLHLSYNGSTYYNITGNVINLPPNLNSFHLANSPTAITGNLNDIPKSVTDFYANKTNLTGNIANLPPNLTYFNTPINSGNITGNIINLPSTLTIFLVSSPNTITGNIINLPPNMTYCEIGGSNTLFGNLEDIPSSLGTFKIDGFNIIEGDFSNVEASDLINLRVLGYNTISGSINDINKDWVVIVKGNNTINGDIANLSSKYTLIEGNNTITGSLHNITTDFYYLHIKGNNTIQNSGTKDYSIVTGNIQIDIVPVHSSFIDTQIDQLINDLNTAGLNNEVVLRLTGGSRTAASDAAYTAITSGGGTISFLPFE